nr:hypothetical protein [Tanacetum cinerariifolium]
MRGTGFQHFLLHVGQLANDLARRPHHQRAIRNHLAFANQRIGADDAVFADLRAVEDHRVDADERVVVDGAAMQHDVVADGHVLADGQRRPHVGVHDRAILHVAVLADVDQLVIPAQHGAEPDAGVGLKPDLADQGGAPRSCTHRNGNSARTNCGPDSRCGGCARGHPDGRTPAEH